MRRLISIIRGLFIRDRIIQIWRLPSARNFRAHLAGLTIGFVLTSLNLAVTSPSANIWLTVALFLWFALTTYFSGIFFLVTFLAFLLSQVSPSSAGAFTANASWYVIGYLGSGIFINLYQALLFLHLLTADKDKARIAFAYDRTRSVNFIKSPIETEEAALLEILKPLAYYLQQIRSHPGDLPTRHANADALRDLIARAYGIMPATDRERLEAMLATYPDPGFLNKLERLRADLENGDPVALQLVTDSIEPLVEKYLKRKETKLYNYKLDAPPRRPYTIAFVANPKILRRDAVPALETSYDRDPILNNLDLFLRSVDRALFSLESDEVLGRPEIWSRVRVIAVFDERLTDGFKHGLVQEFRDTVTINGRVVDNAIEPRPELITNFNNIFPDDIPKIDIDAIFALSASRTHDRASAKFADWIAGRREVSDPPGPAVGFTFNQDPRDTKNPDNHRTPDEIFESGAEVGFIDAHEHSTETPGRAAINVLTASQYTYIHEFAHVMSSAARGAICDEYFDRIEGRRSVPDPGLVEPWFINRIERQERNNGNFIPIHDVFAEFNGTIFYSDKHHPAAREFWLGYFPERPEVNVGCTMDRQAPRFRFDKLLSCFIYDRLIAKLNRP